ncbi:hypothetical protein OEV82_13200, partial [Caldibacillus thermolactis]
MNGRNLLNPHFLSKNIEADRVSLSDCRQTPTQMLHLSWDLSFFAHHFLRFLSYLGWTWSFPCP